MKWIALSFSHSPVRVERQMALFSIFHARWSGILLASVFLGSLLHAQSVESVPAFRNPDLPPDTRAVDLLRRLTLEEKVLQMQNAAPAIPRLGIPAYDWWNEALHGV